MGKSSLTLRPDGEVYDLEYHFPSHLKTVALSMSGGIESTLLLLLLIDFYGADNIIVFSAEYVKRRSWESVNAKATAARLGVHRHYSILQLKEQFSSETSLELFKNAKQQHQFDGWFNGENAKLLGTRSVTSQDVVDLLRSKGFYLPFVFLKKEHAIDMFSQINKEEELHKTFSCSYQPFVHCGKCLACTQRVLGFVELGKIDQATYDRDWDSMVNDYTHLRNI